MNSMSTTHLDAIIKQLKSLKDTTKQASLSETRVRELCQASREIFLKESSLIEVAAPVHIFGDIHGQFNDLLRHLEQLGYPEENEKQGYLFLGDYVDRGRLSLETICLLLCYKIKYPDRFFLLRGNHESASINRIYGFYDECKRRFNIKLWKTFTDCFNCLPIAGIVERTIFCVHGGLSPNFRDLNQIRSFKRPMDIPDHGLATDLVWSDPDEDITGWGENDRGVSWTFGGDIVNSFLRDNNLSLVARAHQEKGTSQDVHVKNQVVEDGYQFFQKRKEKGTSQGVDVQNQLVTLFSAPNYCGEFDNAGAVMSVSTDLLCSFSILRPYSLEIQQKKKKGR